MSSVTAQSSAPRGPSDSAALVDAAVKKITTLATLPEITLHIIRTVEDPKSTATQLHKIIAHDPALVTRILKVVNSAFYGLPGQIASIERAIVLLGLNAVKNIAVAASLGQMFRGVKLCEGFTAKDLWRHCVAVGVVARDLARQLKQPLADEAFLAGMIHDIGMLVALQTSPEALRKVCETAKRHKEADGPLDFCLLERQHMNVDHQMLGARLAELWKFPRSCVLVAGHHHEPQLLSDGDHLLVWLVHVADTICAQQREGFNLTALHQVLDMQALAKYSIDAELIERTRKNVTSLVSESSTLL